jgi:hypothetical protein
MAAVAVDEAADERTAEQSGCSAAADTCKGRRDAVATATTVAVVGRAGKAEAAPVRDVRAAKANERRARCRGRRKERGVMVELTQRNRSRNSEEHSQDELG